MKPEQTIYRITLVCTGVPPKLGPEGAIDITEEFTHRPWHQNVRCEWDGSNLILHAENDYDPDAKALMDEFSDSICAYLEPFDGNIEVRSIEVVG